ncbi:MAG: hypothetical protein H7070_14000 [Saprospiraceae bacterium]|nr:hypothetical protein [Pyrinomonadaceae bacterium]
MQRHHGKIIHTRRPFWLPASNYYILTIAVTIGFFFLVWGVLHEGMGEAPWITAGFGASIILGAAVFLREVILRNARNRFLVTQRKLDKSLRGISARFPDERNSSKLTLERNAAILAEIRQKSAAAKVLGKFSAGHKEVFELCEEYMFAAAQELPNVGIGSPRLPALRKGNDLAVEYHRYHLLQWAEIEARTLTQDAKSRGKVKEKLDKAKKALAVVDFALGSYPGERTLLESHEVLEDFLTSIKVSNSVEKAERAYFKGNFEQSASLYQDALFDLSRREGGKDRKLAAEKIHSELDKIRQIIENG